MRTQTLYANECGMPVDGDGKPDIDADTAQSYIERYAPWACRWEVVCGGIMCWESEDDWRVWREQK